MIASHLVTIGLIALIHTAFSWLFLCSCLDFIFKLINEYKCLYIYNSLAFQCWSKNTDTNNMIKKWFVFLWINQILLIDMDIYVWLFIPTKTCSTYNADSQCSITTSLLENVESSEYFTSEAHKSNHGNFIFKWEVCASWCKCRRVTWLRTDHLI